MALSLNHFSSAVVGKIMYGNVFPVSMRPLSNFSSLPQETSSADDFSLSLKVARRDFYMRSISRSQGVLWRTCGSSAPHYINKVSTWASAGGTKGNTTQAARASPHKPGSRMSVDGRAGMRVHTGRWEGFQFRQEVKVKPNSLPFCLGKGQVNKL